MLKLFFHGDEKMDTGPQRIISSHLVSDRDNKRYEKLLMREMV